MKPSSKVLIGDGFMKDNLYTITGSHNIWKWLTLSAEIMLVGTVFPRLCLPSFARGLGLSIPSFTAFFISSISLRFDWAGCTFHLESFLNLIVLSRCPPFVESASSQKTRQHQYKKNRQVTNISNNQGKFQAKEKKRHGQKQTWKIYVKITHTSRWKK